ncbi:uncharacterized protein [Halyomorpha halys]|uniref:uncharacterized protein n=1 Tax=Halyomorpha halys TaxID=286706 RepID=UPI0006D4C9B1|nr:uncharacterized protein LOC106687441 [Halyomorpha halys]
MRKNNIMRDHGSILKGGATTWNNFSGIVSFLKILKETLKMLSMNESRKRDKRDTMMTFIILKLLYDSINKEEIRQRAEEFLILGRVKLIDQVLYDMAKNRRSKKECPSTPPEEEEGVPPPATGASEHPPALTKIPPPPGKGTGQRVTV